MYEIILLKTLFSAFLWALFGYLARQEDEDFKPEKLVSTLVAAIIVSTLQVTYGIDPETGELITLYFVFKTGMIGVIDKLIKVIWRRSGLKDLYDNLDK